MSWKLFFQIALLIVITAVVMLSAKCMTKSCRSKSMKCMKGDMISTPQ
jgi:hypothetical protein